MLGNKRIVNTDTLLFINMCIANVLISGDVDRISKLRKEIEKFLEYNTNLYNNLKNLEFFNKEKLVKEFSTNIDKLKRTLELFENLHYITEYKYIDSDCKGLKGYICNIDDFSIHDNTIIK